MERKTPVEPIRPGYPPDMLSVMVTLERLPSEQLASFNRKQKYTRLRSYASGLREKLVEWIEQEGLAEQVAQVGEPTVFNALFVTCTPGVAERLVQAPGVVRVAPTGDLRVDLLPRPVTKGSFPEPESKPADEEPDS
jgi:hypothetical protein